MDDAAPVLSFEELAGSLRDAPPATPDDVPITWDGRRLDSREKVLSFLAELDAARSSGRTVGPPLSQLGEFSPERLVTALDRHGVEYLVVGGVAARAYGASRETKDFDCLVRRARDNLDRLAAAMRELNARLRVHGLSEVEAAVLPVQIDALTLNALEISTWSTDAGDLDVLVDIPSRNGLRRGYEDLVPSAHVLDYSGVSVRVAGLDDIIASKEWANRPKDRAALPELHELRKRWRRPRPGDEGLPPDSAPA